MLKPFVGTKKNSPKKVSEKNEFIDKVHSTEHCDKDTIHNPLDMA